MTLRFLVLSFIALTIGALLASASTDDADISELFETDPASVEVEQVCMAVPRRALEGYDLSEPVFDNRFYYARVFGRGGRHLLVEFSQPCDNLISAPGGLGAQTPFCKTDVVVIRNERCAVETLYETDSEDAARVVALKRIVADARAAGKDLPADDAAAADWLLSHSQN